MRWMFSECEVLLFCVVLFKKLFLVQLKFPEGRNNKTTGPEDPVVLYIAVWDSAGFSPL